MLIYNHLDNNNNQIQVSNSFLNKTIFCTGCTGFIGKTFLEKILRTLQVKKIYLLIRPKMSKNKEITISGNDRLMNEILRSPIMDRLIDEKFNGNRKIFENYCLDRIEVIEGDVTDDLHTILTNYCHKSSNDNALSKLYQNIQIIVHIAATVGFTEPLQDAIKLNVFGTLNMLKFAKKCKILEIFCHVSTAYVNSNQKDGSKIYEKLYHLNSSLNNTSSLNNNTAKNSNNNNEMINKEEIIEIEKLCEHFYMNVNDFLQQELSLTTTNNNTTTISKEEEEFILQKTGFINTYTLTKHIAEKLLIYNKGNIPICIIRPSIVGAALNEPFPGWIDSISAGAAVYLFIGLGVLRVIPGRYDAISDQIPVDYVVNCILVGISDVLTNNNKLLNRLNDNDNNGSNSGNGIVKIYHAGTSLMNPGHWKITADSVIGYWQKSPSSKRIRPELIAYCEMIDNDINFKCQFYLKYTLWKQVFSLLELVTKPVVNIAQNNNYLLLNQGDLINSKVVQMASQFTKLEQRAKMLCDSFQHFTMNEWFFDVTNMEGAFSKLSEKERNIYYFNTFDWHHYFDLFCYGIQRFVLKELATPKLGKNNEILQNNIIHLENNNQRYLVDRHLSTGTNRITEKKYTKGIALKDKPTSLIYSFFGEISSSLGNNCFETEREIYCLEENKTTIKDTIKDNIEDNNTIEMSSSVQLHRSENLTSIAGATGTHSFDKDEVESFSDYITTQLANDQDCQKKLPIVGEQLFEVIKDGIVLCKLINIAMPKTIDERVINIKESLNPWQINENLDLAINSAAGIGCKTVNITKLNLQEGKPHIVLGLIWQVIKIALTKEISLKHHPELVHLLPENEELADFVKLPTETILMRWVNYHLKKAGSTKQISGFSNDIKDSEVYTVLLKQIGAGLCDLSPLEVSDLEERAELMLQQADKLGCRKFVKPTDVTKGNPKLNLAFVANLFNNYPALEQVNEEQLNDNDFASLLNLDGEGTREERSFTFWIQSLGGNITNLFDGLQDGIVLLEVMDKIKPNVVDWKKVTRNCKNKFQAVGNCNYAVDTARVLGCQLTGIGGTDIYDKNRKLVLAIVWQLMKINLFNTLKELGGGKTVSEDDVLQWANKKVVDTPIKSFEDPLLKDGSYLIKLCHAVSSRSCDLSMICEDAEQNAKYAISVARKIGATVFLLWEDIVEVKKKMILSFVASLMKVSLDK
ncbi:hypothetical protein ABK040_010201 [Willaertia magna]